MLPAAFACIRSSTLPEPETPGTQTVRSQPAQPQPEETNLSRSWQISPTSEIQHYSTLVTTTVQQSGIPERVIDTVTTRTQYSLGITRSANSELLTGSIDAFITQNGTRIGASPEIISFPVVFAGQIQNHQLQLEPTSISHSPIGSTLPCGIPGKTALNVIVRNLFIPPLHLQSNMTWQDSLSSTSCNGSLELNLATSRNYKVIGESTFNTIPVITVDITEKTLSTGEGSQDQHTLIVKGETLRSSRAYVDVITGILLGLSSETHTTLQIQASGQVHQFIQTSKETTTRI
jgi:hypothetical protein